ncbi:MAG TPA: translation initiation factor IF-3 [Longimicrobium sp.]
MNRQIRISPVRVISPEGEQLGILPIERAQEIAEEQGLDLVEVAPLARPPVCRIMDYGKFKYEEQRQQREARKKQHHVQIKEVKMRPGIEDHDYDFKLRHARRFLEEGNKVKLTMMFRGRQMAHPEFGRQVLDRVSQALQDISKVEQHPMMEGRSMVMMLAPLKTVQPPAGGGSDRPAPTGGGSDRPAPANDGGGARPAPAPAGAPQRPAPVSVRAPERPSSPAAGPPERK